MKSKNKTVQTALNSVAKNEMSSRDIQTIGDAIDEARRNLQLAIRFCKANAGEDNFYVKNLPALEKALKELWKF